ncbi:MAG TPA: carboxypeptidase regulatory-like domain-containing protein [Vicinamibacterales bacterium]|nr:carboxypeptidase regulatory-like domain-containing protein [Vicinamibacterales bacterium]
MARHPSTSLGMTLSMSKGQTGHTVIKSIAAVTVVAWLTTTLVAQAPRQAATPQTLRGRVVADADGQPLINARIVVKGTATSARAGLEGAFTLVAAPGATLVVTKAGYVRMELPAAQVGTIRLVRAVAIGGRVTTDTGEPVPGANVVVMTNGEAPAPQSPRANTDDRGEYRIGGLPPGRYTVAARSVGRDRITIQLPNGGTGYTIQTFNTYFPDTLNKQDATAIALVAGDERRDIDFHLPVSHTDPGQELPNIVGPDVNLPVGTAEINGSILDANGRPLPSAQVELLALGKGSRMKRGEADAGGSFAFTGIPGGTYRVLAALPGYSMAADGFMSVGLSNPSTLGTGVTVGDDERQTGIRVILAAWGSVSGRVVDEVGEPVPGATVSLLVTRFVSGRQRLIHAKPQTQTTDDHGEFRVYAVNPGRYILTTSIGETTAVDLPGYGPTYYPGSGTAAEAQYVNVRAGEQVAGLEFALVPAATASIRGHIVDSTGKPWTGRFNLIPRSLVSARIDARIEPDGRFEFSNVPPGQYVIQADRGRLGGNIEGEFLAYPVTVGRSDVTGLDLHMSAGLHVMGHVTFESTLNTTPPDPAKVEISPLPVDFDTVPSSVAVTSPDKDGHFELQGITGARRLQVTRVPTGWSLRAILVGGRNVTDEVLQFDRANQAWNDVEVVLTDRVNEVSGRVSDANARAVPDARVIVFSTDPNAWYPGSRFVSSTVSNADGSYSLQGLPTGSYLTAIGPNTPGDDSWQDPAFLDSLRLSARLVTLSEGQPQIVNLRLPSR